MAHVTRSQLAAYAVIAVAVLVLGGRWLARGTTQSAAPRAPAVEAAGPGGVPKAPDVEEPPRAVLVHVAGAVRRPGVYRVGAGARVRDAVRRAGGATRQGDANAVNLAALVQDGAQVVIPRRVAAVVAGAGGLPATGAADPAGVVAAPPVNLNAATPEELQTLDGVGPATAADIIEYRTQQGGFRSVDDLDQVPGIGPKTMEALRDKVVV